MPLAAMCKVEPLAETMHRSVNDFTHEFIQQWLQSLLDCWEAGDFTRKGVTTRSRSLAARPTPFSSVSLSACEQLDTTEAQKQQGERVNSCNPETTNPKRPASNKLTSPEYSVKQQKADEHGNGAQRTHCLPSEVLRTRQST